MAATYTTTRVTAYTEANKKVRVWDVALSGTYTTGGDVIPTDAFGRTLGLRKVEEFIVHNGADDGTVQYPVSFSYSTLKVKLYESGGAAGTAAAEKAAGEALTNIQFRVTVKGF